MMRHALREVLEPFTLTRMRRGEMSIPLRPPLDLLPGDRVLPMESALIAYRDGRTLATYAVQGGELIRRWSR
jgi:hypothetical protein